MLGQWATKTYEKMLILPVKQLLVCSKERIYSVWLHLEKKRVSGSLTPGPLPAPQPSPTEWLVNCSTSHPLCSSGCHGLPRDIFCAVPDWASLTLI